MFGIVCAGIVSHHGSGGFTPDSISGLIHWLDSSSLTLNDNDDVVTWEDGSSGGHDMTGPISQRPVYKTNIANGKPAVRFNGSNDCMKSTDSIISGSTNRTLSVVCNPTSTGVLPIASYGNDTATGQTFDLTPEIAVRTDGGNRIWTTSHSGSVKIITVELDGTSTTDLSAWLNATSLSVSSTGALAVNTAASGRLGCNFVEANFYDGDIFELALYNRAITSGERTQLWTYYSNKYGIIF